MFVCFVIPSHTPNPTQGPDSADRSTGADSASREVHAVTTNLARIIPDPEPRHGIVYNLAGLIDECAMQDGYLLDESMDTFRLDIADM